MDKVYWQVRFASMLKTPYSIKEEIDDVEYSLTLMLAATSLVHDYPNVIDEPYTVEGIRNAIAKLLDARRKGYPDVMRAIFYSKGHEAVRTSYFSRNCQTFYAKLHLLHIADLNYLVERLYISAIAKLDTYLKFYDLLKEEKGEEGNERKNKLGEQAEVG